jgi:hypothetical protein
MGPLSYHSFNKIKLYPGLFNSVSATAVIIRYTYANMIIMNGGVAKEEEESGHT